MIAILTVDANVKLMFYIYETNSSKTYDVSNLTDFSLANRKYNIQVFGIDNGFSVMKGNSINIIWYQQGANIDVPFAKINVDGTMGFRYAFIGHTVYRWSIKGKKLESTKILCLLEQYPGPTDWDSISFPNLPFYKDESLFQNLAYMTIPITSPVCHFECPHCQLLDRGYTGQQRSFRHTFTGNYRESDPDSDDDCFKPCEYYW